MLYMSQQFNPQQIEHIVKADLGFYSNIDYFGCQFTYADFCDLFVWDISPRMFPNPTLSIVDLIVCSRMMLNYDRWKIRSSFNFNTLASMHSAPGFREFANIHLAITPGGRDYAKLFPGPVSEKNIAVEFKKGKPIDNGKVDGERVIAVWVDLFNVLQKISIQNLYDFEKFPEYRKSIIEAYQREVPQLFEYREQNQILKLNHRTHVFSRPPRS